MISQSLVSIVIPCYNQGKYLDECLSSVFSSSYSFIEVIVVNDGSTDNTQDFIIQLQKKFDFKAILQDNKGLASSRNVGIKASQGEFILPLDSDDKIGVFYIEKALNVLKTEEGIGIVYCEAELFGEQSGKWKLPTFSLKKILSENLIFNCALFRRSDFDKTNGYNSNMKEGWEDWDFWLSLIELNLDVFCLDEVGFYYRIRKNSMVRSLNAEKNSRLRKQIFENHIKLYLDHFENPIQLYHQIKELEEFEKSFHHLKKSYDYRLGKLLLLPLRTIKKLIK